MSMFSGINGTVKFGSPASDSGIIVHGWTFNPSTAVHKRSHNQSGGFKAAVAGARDSSGTIMVSLDKNGHFPFHDNDDITLQLHVDDSGSNYFSVPAIIESTPVELDIDDGQIVGGTFAFQGNGPWTGHGICSKLQGSSGN